MHTARLSSIELVLLQIEVLSSGNRDFRPICSCDLDLDPMTFIYELDPYSLKISRVTTNELSTSKLWKVCIIIIRTYTTEKIVTLRLVMK